MRRNNLPILFYFLIDIYQEKRAFVYKLFLKSFILLLFSLYLRFSKTIRLMKELSKQTTTEVSIILNRSIFFFYEKSLRYVPVFLMLCHWYGVYSFHENPREILIDIRENEECIVYLYFMVYIFPVVFMLPASHFFKLCCPRSKNRLRSRTSRSHFLFHLSGIPDPDIPTPL